jgi:hypothetical protein
MLGILFRARNTIFAQAHTMIEVLAGRNVRTGPAKQAPVLKAGQAPSAATMRFPITIRGNPRYANAYVSARPAIAAECKQYARRRSSARTSQHGRGWLETITQDPCALDMTRQGKELRKASPGAFHRRPCEKCSRALPSVNENSIFSQSSRQSRVGPGAAAVVPRLPSRSSLETANINGAAREVTRDP